MTAADGNALENRTNRVHRYPIIVSIIHLLRINQSQIVDVVVVVVVLDDIAITWDGVRRWSISIAYLIPETTSNAHRLELVNYSWHSVTGSVLELAISSNSGPSAYQLRPIRRQLNCVRKDWHKSLPLDSRLNRFNQDGWGFWEDGISLRGLSQCNQFLPNFKQLE